MHNDSELSNFLVIFENIMYVKHLDAIFEISDGISRLSFENLL